MNPVAMRLYWRRTALLAAHFIGRPEAMPLALAVDAPQSAPALAVRRGLAHLEVQVRVAFLGLLLTGALPGAWPVHATRFVGTKRCPWPASARSRACSR